VPAVKQGQLITTMVKTYKKIELCKECYDQYLAKEMVQYWKDHIEEEKRRSGK
jgi:hypothetical protein